MTTADPTVVLASPRAVAGGAQRALAMLAPGLADRGWTVQALLGEYGWLARDLTARGVPTRIAGAAPPNAATLTGDGAPPTVVLSLGAGGHAWAGPAAADAGVPAAWWLELTLRGRPAEAAALAVPAALVGAPNPTAAAVLRDRTDTPVLVIPPGVDPGPVGAHAAATSTLRSGLGLGPATRLVVMVARLHAAKGQDTVVDACGHLVAGGRDLVLALVGDALVGDEGDIASALRRRAEQAGLGGRLVMTGHVDDPGPWHAAADVSVQASTHEAFGLSIVEALAHRSPVVASDTDGPAWILGDGRYGLVVPPGDAAATATATARVLDDDALATRLADGGPDRAAEFGPDRAADAWDAALRAAYRPAGVGR